jgi:hypothetical protein
MPLRRHGESRPQLGCKARSALTAPALVDAVALTALTGIDALAAINVTLVYGTRWNRGYLRVETTIHNIMKLAERADQLAREIDSYRVRVERGGGMEFASLESPHRTNIVDAPNRASVMAISQFGQCCRDFHSGFATATAVLSDDLKRQLGIEVTT